MGPRRSPDDLAAPMNPFAHTPAPSFDHLPVMVDEVVELFAPVPPGTVVDATVGGGGHATAILAAHRHLGVLGLDQDPDAVASAAACLARYGERATVRQARFDALVDVLASVGDPRVTGALFDLGVSSPQLDRPERGFSHRAEGPLDMRMDTTQGRTAADIVNDEPVDELTRLLRTYGDERYASRVARAIVAARPIATTTELADVIRGAIPAPARRTGGNPATRSFQAVRIAVNDELQVLPDAIDVAIETLAPAGRCVVLAYHSGEDRIVKARLREAATGGCTCPPGLPCGCGAVPVVRLLKRGAWKPSAAEVDRNPRAASARLRAVEKLEQGAA